MTTAAAEQLVTIVNHHVGRADLPEITSDDYVAYFESKARDQMVFVAKRGERVAMLYMGDADWEPLTVGAPRSDEEKAWRARLESSGSRLKVHPLLGADVLLDAEEWSWLDLCWAASALFRGESEELLGEEERENKVSEEAKDWAKSQQFTSLPGRDAWPTSNAHRSFLRTVYVVAGIEFGRRQYDDRFATTWFAAVMNVVLDKGGEG